MAGKPGCTALARLRGPLGFVIAAGLLLLWAQFAASPQSQRITYAAFKQLLYNDKIDSGLIAENTIRGVVRGEAVTRGIPRVFNTAKVADPALVKEPETRGVYGKHVPATVPVTGRRE